MSHGGRVKLHAMVGRQVEGCFAAGLDLNGDPGIDRYL
jgi:hypothetical protein